MNEANESVEQFDFLSILEPVKIFEDLQVTVCEGSENSFIKRNQYKNYHTDKTKYDTVNNKIINREDVYYLILIEGSFEVDTLWNEGEINREDLERYFSLNSYNTISSDNLIFDSIDEALEKNSFKTVHVFGYDYENLSERAEKYVLSCQINLKALSDKTKYFCCLTDGSDYQIKVLDLKPNQSKQINKQSDTNYIFFSEQCKINNELTIDKYSVKKLTSNIIDIKNISENNARIISISK